MECWHTTEAAVERSDVLWVTETLRTYLTWFPFYKFKC